MPDVLIGLGGNVGDVRARFDQAVYILCDCDEVRLRVHSSDYRTPPWGVTDQPAFINRCIAVECWLTAGALLQRALALEQILGRDRSKELRWGPRPIDIDLLDYGSESYDQPGLRLPHPELLARAFVLVPLAEIAPERIIAGVRVRDALAALDTSGIERLPPREITG